MSNTSERYDEAYFQGLRPDPLLLVSQWADRHRMLSSVSSSEPGAWRTARTPYLREVMDCLSPSSPVERVVFMSGSQLGKTECGLNWLGYIIHQKEARVSMGCSFFGQSVFYSHQGRELGEIANALVQGLSTGVVENCPGGTSHEKTRRGCPGGWW